MKNEKKMIYNEFVIKDMEDIAEYAKPLLKGNAEHCQILLGDLTMDSDTLLSNLEKVEEEPRLNNIGLSVLTHSFSV